MDNTHAHDMALTNYDVNWILYMYVDMLVELWMEF